MKKVFLGLVLILFSTIEILGESKIPKIGFSEELIKDNNEFLADRCIKKDKEKLKSMKNFLYYTGEVHKNYYRRSFEVERMQDVIDFQLLNNCWNKDYSMYLENKYIENKKLIPILKEKHMKEKKKEYKTLLN